MKRVLTAAVLIPVVIVALFRAPLWLFTLLVMGVALLAAKEYFDIAEKTGFRPMRATGYQALLLAFSAFYIAAYVIVRLTAITQEKGGSVGVDVRIFGMATTLWVVAAGVTLVMFGLIFLGTSLRHESIAKALPDAAVSCLMLPYVAFTLGLLPMMRAGENGALFLLFLMLLVWCGDIAAYYVGRAIGKHKLAPRISPGKTWEGAIASILAAMVIAIVLFREITPISHALAACHLIPQVKFNPALMIPIELPLSAAAKTYSVPVWFAALLGLFVNIAAQLGDLVESALKRGAGMKDSGRLLPGHGGVLDRIDALLFALPVGLLFYLVVMSRYFESAAMR